MTFHVSILFCLADRKKLAGYWDIRYTIKRIHNTDLLL